MKQNPFEKYLTQEDHLQFQIMWYIYGQYRNRCLFFHVPNEGKRSAFERFKFKKLGAKRGVSDILILRSGPRFLAMEVKVIYASGQKNKATPDQTIFLEDVKKYDGESMTVWTFEEAKIIIDEFMKD